MHLAQGSRAYAALSQVLTLLSLTTILLVFLVFTPLLVLLLGAVNAAATVYSAADAVRATTHFAFSSLLLLLSAALHATTVTACHSSAGSGSVCCMTFC
jgi:hypothetical protein